MCKEHQKEQELFEKDADRLHDLITDAIDKWQESNHDDEFESTEMVVPTVFKEILASHFLHHFTLSEKSIDNYMSIFKDKIYSAHGDKIRRLAEKQMEKEDVSFSEHGLA